MLYAHIFGVLDYVHCMCIYWCLGLPSYRNRKGGLHFSHSEFQALIYLVGDFHSLQRKMVLIAGPSYKHRSPFCSLRISLWKRCSVYYKRKDYIPISRYSIFILTRCHQYAAFLGCERGNLRICHLPNLSGS